MVEPGGNHGDRLIYKGMRKKLRHLSINHEVFHYNESIKFPFFSKLYFGLWCRFLKVFFYFFKFNQNCSRPIKKVDRWIYGRILNPFKIQASSSDVILIHGGGNMNDLWHGIRLLKNIIQQHPDNALIVAPQSYWFEGTCFPSLFSKTSQKIYLFCREKISYQLLTSLNLPKNVHVLLSPDTSLYLTKEDFHANSGEYTLFCLRTDKESAMFQQEENNQLLWQVTSTRWQLKRKILMQDLSIFGSFKDFVALIEASKKVYTDRLHVAILAAILGKKTVLYPNSYYKNKAVYEYSLSNYPNVIFDPYPPSPAKLKQTVIMSINE
ncbi:MAG: polysaccharide pyruvyl transferase family protein [Tenericutes bacterium]|nr:polysaccharide pyruvyl transferase family protein [Mycoplasmatota bacterium]